MKQDEGRCAFLKFLDHDGVNPCDKVKIARPWRKDDTHNSCISRGTIQRRFACLLRKDDTHKSRSVVLLSDGADAAVSLVSVDTLGT